MRGLHILAIAGKKKKKGNRPHTDPEIKPDRPPPMDKIRCIAPSVSDNL